MLSALPRAARPDRLRNHTRECKAYKEKVARATGLEPATSGVTGRHSNRLSYARASDRRSGVGAV